MKSFCVSDIYRVQYWACNVSSHRHRTKKEAERCFSNRVKVSDETEIHSVNITISALEGYSYNDICIKHKHPGADVKYHVRKILRKIIQKYDIDYDLFYRIHDPGDKRDALCCTCFNDCLNFDRNYFRKRYFQTFTQAISRD